MLRKHTISTSLMLTALTVLVVACGSNSTPRAAVGSSTSGSSPTSTPATLAARSGPGPAPAGAIEETVVNVQYSTTAITAPHGSVAVHLVNNETHPDNCPLADDPHCYDHDFVLTTLTGVELARSQRVTPGTDAVLSIDDLPAGEYRFHCSISGHAVGGMAGSFTAT